jgi:hypothetical protein
MNKIYLIFTYKSTTKYKIFAFKYLVQIFQSGCVNAAVLKNLNKLNNFCYSFPFNDLSFNFSAPGTKDS